MILVVLAQAGLNTGDIIFQLIMFVVLLLIPAGGILLFMLFRNRNNRLKRVEDKLDQLLESQEKKKS